MQAAEIDEAPVHDVVCAGLKIQLVENVDLVHRTGGNIDETGDIPAKIQQRVQSDRAFSPPEFGPGKQAQAQIDVGGVQHINRRLEPAGDNVVGMQTTRVIDQHHRKVGPDLPGSSLVGVGESGARNRAANAKVIQLNRNRAQARLDVAQRIAIGQLRKEHDKKLIPAGKGSNAPIAAVPGNAFVEFVSRNKVQKLSEDESSCMHLRQHRCPGQQAKPTKAEDRS